MKTLQLYAAARRRSPAVEPRYGAIAHETVEVMVMRIVIFAAASLVLVVWTPGRAAAEGRAWTAEAIAGHAGFVDDSTKHFLVAGLSVHRAVTPRLRIGPELVVMTGGSGGVRDRNVLLAGKIVFDLRRDEGAKPARIVPFLVGSAGIFWARDIVRGGYFWSRQPGATAGAGVRARVGGAMSASLEYRIGSELYQQITGVAGFHW
jgi:hypothetical protein